jgi:hypothetical protein
MNPNLAPNAKNYQKTYSCFLVDMIYVSTALPKDSLFKWRKRKLSTSILVYLEYRLWNLFREDTIRYREYSIVRKTYSYFKVNSWKNLCRTQTTLLKSLKNRPSNQSISILIKNSLKSLRTPAYPRLLLWFASKYTYK